jgi:radical SAM protein with 4Fe4S-binding SPASM domain
MSRQIRADKGGKPWCIKPELVEGCNRSCSFCGINAIREKPGIYKYMTICTIEIIAKECSTFCPTARYEFAGKGEPLMHPQYLEMLKIFRSYLQSAQIMLTTNGDILRGKMQEKTELLFENGVNFILMDTYYPEPARTNLRKEAHNLENIKVVDYFEDWAPVGESPYYNHRNKIQKTIVLLDDLAARDGEYGTRMLKTHAGSNPTKQINEPLMKKCSRPFREMQISWNGDITLCCDDWRKEFLIGNVHNNSIENIWKHPRLEAARARLNQKDRNFGPCQYCDAPSQRAGLLPIYEEPTQEQIKLTEKIFKPKRPLWKK